MKNIVIFMTALVISGALVLSHSDLQAQSAADAGAIADAEQAQGQAQNQTSNLTGVGNSPVSFNNSFNSDGVEVPRDLPIPTAAGYTTTGGPAMFTRPDPEETGPNFMSMSHLVGVLNNVDLDEAEIKDEDDVKVVVQMINAVNDPEDRTRAAERIIDFKLNPAGGFMKAMTDFVPVAVITLKADDSETMNSATIAIKLAKIARSIHAPRIVLIKEGVIKRLTSSGWGIGLSFNYASVGSSMSDNGQVGAGGTGYSTGQASYLMLPYITAVVGR